MASHWFADETKDPKFLMAVAVAAPRQLVPGRAAIKQLLMHGQDRIHFTKERESRRGPILRTIANTEIMSILYDASAIEHALEARKACLESILTDAAAGGAHRLVIENDKTMYYTDRKILYAKTVELDCHDKPGYEHMCAHDEPLLWIADAVAWCWGKGGHWREKVRPLVSEVRYVEK